MRAFSGFKKVVFDNLCFFPVISSEGIDHKSDGDTITTATLTLNKFSKKKAFSKFL